MNLRTRGGAGRGLKKAEIIADADVLNGSPLTPFFFSQSKALNMSLTRSSMKKRRSPMCRSTAHSRECSSSHFLKHSFEQSVTRPHFEQEEIPAAESASLQLIHPILQGGPSGLTSKFLHSKRSFQYNVSSKASVRLVYMYLIDHPVVS